METQMFMFKRKVISKDAQGNFLKNSDGTYQYEKEENVINVQGALRPIELWEYVFPEESLQEVLAMMEVNKNYNELRPEMQRVAWLLRKGTGAKKIPDMPVLKSKERWQITPKYIPMAGMAVYPVGIKFDNKQDYIFGNEGFFQEGL